MNEINETQLAWIAGILEGEGSFVEKHVKKGGRNYYYAKIQCGMTDEDVVRRLHTLTGVGNVNGPSVPRKAGHKPMWHWSVGAQADVIPLLRALKPLMGKRRSEKIAYLLDAYNVIT